MTDLPFALNGIDFRSAVNKNSYKTFLEPVYAGEMETLGKVRIRPLKRYRGGLHVGLNDLEENESADQLYSLTRSFCLLSIDSKDRVFSDKRDIKIDILV